MAKQKELKPVLAPEAPAKALRAEIVKVLRAAFFDPLLASIDLTLNNAAPGSKLLRQIESGRIQYTGSAFVGKFDSQVSKELRELGATFSKLDKTWRVSPQSSPRS